jgi:glucokinase
LRRHPCAAGKTHNGFLPAAPTSFFFRVLRGSNSFREFVIKSCYIAAEQVRRFMAANSTGLIADVGATNARFALAGPEGIHDELILKCADYPDIASAVDAYLATLPQFARPARAAVAIAGPVVGDRFEMTNHAWSFSVNETRARLGFTQFTVMNDFKAIALAVPHLTSYNLRQVGEGQPAPNAPIGVIGPGTGLGVASLFWDGRHYQPAPGEGGHITMAARDQREFDIFRTLRYKYRHVSAERVCSGKGLHNIYEALRILDGRSELPDRTPEEISKAALDGSCSVCVEALDKMIGFLGSVAGDLALTLGALGGIYIAGGIVNQLGDWFYRSRFRKQFLSKGRFSDYLAPIPTYVIQHEFPAFIGLHGFLMQGE